MRIQLTDSHAVLPQKGSAHAAGYDLTSIETKTLVPGERYVFKTGLKLEIPVGLYGRIAPRSGLSSKKGIDVMAGVIDADYRGELGVLLINLSSENVTLNAGDKIAQIIFETYHDVVLQSVPNLNDTDRGAGGFGSTGQ